MGPKEKEKESYKTKFYCSKSRRIKGGAGRGRKVGPFWPQRDFPAKKYHVLVSFYVVETFVTNVTKVTAKMARSGKKSPIRFARPRNDVFVKYFSSFK
jgi:hypothetical protein